jgi:hypothetical protein
MAPGAGAAPLPSPLAREAARRGARVRSARSALTRPIGLVSRPGPRSPAARAFAALVTGDGKDH